MPLVSWHQAATSLANASLVEVVNGIGQKVNDLADLNLQLRKHLAEQEVSAKLRVDEMPMTPDFARLVEEMPCDKFAHRISELSSDTCNSLELHGHEGELCGNVTPDFQKRGPLGKGEPCGQGSAGERMSIGSMPGERMSTGSILTPIAELPDPAPQLTIPVHHRGSPPQSPVDHRFVTISANHPESCAQPSPVVSVAFNKAFQPMRQNDDDELRDLRPTCLPFLFSGDLWQLKPREEWNQEAFESWQCRSFRATQSATTVTLQYVDPNLQTVAVLNFSKEHPPTIIEMKPITMEALTREGQREVCKGLHNYKLALGHSTHTDIAEYVNDIPHTLYPFRVSHTDSAQDKVFAAQSVEGRDLWIKALSLAMGGNRSYSDAVSGCGRCSSEPVEILRTNSYDQDRGADASVEAPDAAERCRASFQSTPSTIVVPSVFGCEAKTLGASRASNTEAVGFLAPRSPINTNGKQQGTPRSTQSRGTPRGVSIAGDVFESEEHYPSGKSHSKRRVSRISRASRASTVEPRKQSLMSGASAVLQSLRTSFTSSRPLYPHDADIPRKCSRGSAAIRPHIDSVDIVDSIDNLGIREEWTEVNTHLESMQSGNARGRNSVASQIVFGEERADSSTWETDGIRKIVEYHGSLKCIIGHPNQKSRMAFEMLGLVLIVHDLITLPLQVFDVYPIDAMDWIALVYWTVNIPLACTTGFVREGVLVLNPHDIFKNYMQTWFVVDIAIVLPDWLSKILSFLAVDQPIDAAGSGDGTSPRLFYVIRLVRFARLARLLRLRKVWNMLCDLIDSEKAGIAVNIFKMIWVMVMVNHFLACGWFLAGDLQTGNSWIKVHGFTNGEADWLYQYTTAYHWGLTQFTPASMDVQPQCLIERVFTIVVIVFGLVGFSYLIGSMTGSLTQLRSLGEREAKLFWTLRRFLKSRNVSRDLSLRIRSYSESRWRHDHRLQPMEGVELVSKLSEPLLLELQAQMYSPFLCVLPLLKRLSFASRVTSCRVARSATSVWLAGHDFFSITGEVAPHIAVIMNGSLEYVMQENHEDQNFKWPLDQSDGFWIAEPVLWLQSWKYLGDLCALSSTEMLLVYPKKFADEVLRNAAAYRIVSKYAQNYVNWMKSSNYFFSDISHGDDIDFEELMKRADSDGSSSSSSGFSASSSPLSPGRFNMRLQPIISFLSNQTQSLRQQKLFGRQNTPQ